MPIIDVRVDDLFWRWLNFLVDKRYRFFGLVPPCDDVGTSLGEQPFPDDTACTLAEWNAKVDALLAECQLEEPAP